MGAGPISGFTKCSVPTRFRTGYRTDPRGVLNEYTKKGSHAFPGLPGPSQDLLVDQTIEKVSFCAPDRNLDKAFSYICRDGTTRRWICHCFLALKDSVSISKAQSPLTLLSHVLVFHPHRQAALWSQPSHSCWWSGKGGALRAPHLEDCC